MKNIKFFTLALVASLLISNCTQEAVNIEGKGDNFFRLPAAVDPVTIVGFSAEPGLKTVPLLEVIRDANSEASLAAPATVNLKIDKTIIDDARRITFIENGKTHAVEPN